ncbi:MAG: AAA family ATPase [Paludibacteraceae bacterium]|nr:AAA family ATPase [Paludibacteraceae bacterium]
MKRKIYNRLKEWKMNRSHQEALLIDGARRVGKSYIVKEFGQNEYRSYMLFDFSNISSDVLYLFDHYLTDLDTLFSRLTLLLGVSLYEHESLIIFDEVQNYPKIRQAIKHLVADGRYDYIETGSLMSIHYNVKDILIPSEEVHINMYPMDFEEFLWAMGEERLMDYVRECFSECKPLDVPLHRKMMEFVRLYTVIGGMPQAIQAYVDHKDFVEVDGIKRRILTLYREDIQKYAFGQSERVTRIFDAIPGQLQCHEKKFKLVSLGHGSRMRSYENAFFWLQESRVVNVCYNVTAPEVNLEMFRGDKFKLYLADTGLLVSMAFQDRVEVREVYSKLLQGKLEMNKGMVMENMVAQMLVASGKRLFFFSSVSPTAEDRMEIDFLLRKSQLTSRHNIHPVEVKSATRFRTTSLDKFCKKYVQRVATSIVLSTENLRQDGNILYLPLYMTPLL